MQDIEKISIHENISFEKDGYYSTSEIGKKLKVFSLKKTQYKKILASSLILSLVLFIIWIFNKNSN